MTSSPASRATPAPEREAHMLAVGTQCSEESCHLVDFLPFKCQHCSLSFCQEHFKVDAHRCQVYDESKHNRVAPNCPLCNSPVAIPPGEDPNVRMDTHLTRECPVMTGKERQKSMPVCAKGICKKVLFSPIKCTYCREQFCPAHRFPKDHNCASQAVQGNRNPGGASTTSSSSKTAASRLLSEFTSSKASAIKKTVSTASASLNKSNNHAKETLAPSPVSKSSSAVTEASTATSSSSKSKSPNSINNPFSKVDRRAKAEKESRLRAMRERAKKGLLSEEEKAVLAAEEASAKDDKDCLIM